MKIKYNCDYAYASVRFRSHYLSSLSCYILVLPIGLISHLPYNIQGVYKVSLKIYWRIKISYKCVDIIVNHLQ
jgi:hypothetical protein